MSSIAVPLPDELKAFVESEAAAAGYHDSAQYVRAVLHSLWQHKSREALEATLVNRIDGPPGIEATPQFWSDLKTRLNRRLQESGR
jgi:antitoxin ParD1/3/4